MTCRVAPSSEATVAFSGWTAVVATAMGGLPLLLVKSPDAIPESVLGYANALAAGMMLGAGIGMTHGRFLTPSA